MIPSLYPPFIFNWSAKGSVWILSDLHLGDPDCKLMDPDWIPPEEQIAIINSKVHKNDTFVCLGDVGDPQYLSGIKSKNRVLILGNHDKIADYRGRFEEIYKGPLFISDKILLSHEPISGLPWCLNIHGHDHNGAERYDDGCHFLNLAANVCNYTPISLGELIKRGGLSGIKSIHRLTIDAAKEKKEKR